MSFLRPSVEWCNDPSYQQLVQDAVQTLVDTSAHASPPAPPADAPAQAEVHRGWLRTVVISSAEDFSEAFHHSMEQLLMYERRGILETDAAMLPKLAAAPSRKGEVPCGGIAVWQGDITTLRVGAIVNAGNDALLGCFQPTHVCVDNVIHSHSGPRLRGACHEIMQGKRLPVGEVKVTSAYLLPSDHVIHTVGPQAQYQGQEQPLELSRCYTNSLEACAAHGIRSVAFCCISTGLFGYPQEAAAKVAWGSVREWLSRPENAAHIDVVVFNTFTDRDHEIYTQLWEELQAESAH